MNGRSRRRGIRHTGEEEARGHERGDIAITAADEVLMRSVLSRGGEGGFLVEGALGFLLLSPQGAGVVFEALR